MAYRTNCIDIGSSNLWQIYLERVEHRIYIKRRLEVNYETMEDYIDNQEDKHSQWQDDVRNGRTDDSYEEWLNDYEYPYSDYYCYDHYLDIYYDENDESNTHDSIDCRYNGEDLAVENLMNDFHSYYDGDNFEFENGMNEDIMEEKIRQMYKDYFIWKEEQDRLSKPHWNAFDYYK